MTNPDELIPRINGKLAAIIEQACNGTLGDPEATLWWLEHLAENPYATASVLIAMAGLVATLVELGVPRTTVDLILMHSNPLRDN